METSNSSQDQSQNNLSPSWLRGKNNCALLPNGDKQSPSAFCWFWMGLLIVGYIMNVCLLASGAQDKYACDKDTRSRMRYIFAALIGLIIGALNLYIFYNHCSSCNGWAGFFITLVISIAWGLVSNYIAPVCTKGFYEQQL